MSAADAITLAALLAGLGIVLVLVEFDRTRRRRLERGAVARIDRVVAVRSPVGGHGRPFVLRGRPTAGATLHNLYGAAPIPAGIDVVSVIRVTGPGAIDGNLELVEPGR